MYKIDTNENLLFSIGNSTQCSMVTLMGSKSKKRVIYYTFNGFTLLYSRNQHSIVKQLHSNKIFFKEQVREVSRRGHRVSDSGLTV